MIYKTNIEIQVNILYRLVACKVRYFKPLFVIILMIKDYSL